MNFSDSALIVQRVGQSEEGKEETKILKQFRPPSHWRFSFPSLLYGSVCHPFCLVCPCQATRKFIVLLWSLSRPLHWPVRDSPSETLPDLRQVLGILRQSHKKAILINIHKRRTKLSHKIIQWRTLKETKNCPFPATFFDQHLCRLWIILLFTKHRDHKKKVA